MYYTREPPSHTPAHHADAINRRLRAIRKTKYEILLHAAWIEVSHDIWRSWTGARRKSGRQHIGPVYILGTDERA